MFPTGQCFKAYNPPGSEVHLRLKVRNKLTVFNRSLQIRLTKHSHGTSVDAAVVGNLFCSGKATLYFSKDCLYQDLWFLTCDLRYLGHLYQLAVALQPGELKLLKAPFTRNYAGLPR